MKISSQVNVTTILLLTLSQKCNLITNRQTDTQTRKHDAQNCRRHGIDMQRIYHNATVRVKKNTTLDTKTILT